MREWVFFLYYRRFVAIFCRFGRGATYAGKTVCRNEFRLFRIARRTFGMTAHRWSVKQKRRELIRMIEGGEANTKAMSERLGFHLFLIEQ